MKYRLPLFFLLLAIYSAGFAQIGPEREHRIKRSQFPMVAAGTVPNEAKNIKYYREIDSSKITYILKFRLKKMDYHLDLDKLGQIQQIGFRVKEVDIPQDTYAQISNFLEDRFQMAKIRRMLHYYPGNSDNVLKNAYQNLILPNNTYQLLFRGKVGRERKEYLATFDAEGNIVNIRVALPANYDHILY